MTDSISQIKQKLDIVDVIGAYVSLKKAGKNYKGVCPFHSENTPSFMVSQELQIFKCFGCGESGDMFSFIEKLEGVDFTGALELLAEKAGVALEKSDYDAHAQLKKHLFYINDLTAKFYNYLLTKHVLGRDGLAYISKKRELTNETVQKFQLGYAPMNGDVLIGFLLKKNITLVDMFAAGVVSRRTEGSGYIDKFRGRITFPFVGIDGKVVGFSARTIYDKEPKYLNTSETLVFQKSSFLYGLDKAKLEIKKHGAVFVEGQMDVISAHQGGFTNVIASSGTAITDNQLDILSRYTKDLIFCLDSDTAGVAAVFRAVDLAEKKDFNIKIALLPEGFKDIDELIKKDKSGVEHMLSHAVPAYDFFITATVKKYDTHSPDGKKKIMEDLTAKFSTMHNKVLLDHYSQEIAFILGLSKDTVLTVLTTNNSNLLHEPKKSTPNYQKEATVLISPTKTPEYYLIALILHLDILSIDTTLKLLKSSDFTDKVTASIFDALLYYRQNNTDFNINKLLESLIDSERDLTRDLYLSQDLESLSPELLQIELDNTIKRIKKESTRRRIKLLSEKIKLAEKENNDKLIGELTSELKDLSKELY
jgi:DNA primase